MRKWAKFIFPYDNQMYSDERYDPHNEEKLYYPENGLMSTNRRYCWNITIKHILYADDEQLITFSLQEF